MESGLEDRNNELAGAWGHAVKTVSMESGLEDRNNEGNGHHAARAARVSMESGLEDRNNPSTSRVLTAITGPSSQWSPA